MHDEGIATLDRYVAPGLRLWVCKMPFCIILKNLCSDAHRTCVRRSARNGCCCVLFCKGEKIMRNKCKGMK